MTLVGPSGCGKSTTLNMLAGLDDVTEGEIYIDDQEVSSLPPGERDIAMVFQSYALYPHMSVRDNLAFALMVRKESRAATRRKSPTRPGCSESRNSSTGKPRQLSGGQRQRVALGRALVREPRLFLLDEPLSNLDAKLRVQMRAELKLLFDRLATTVVYVTHDQAEAMTMSDRVAIFDKGVVQQVGTPLELYNRPVNVFVAGFLGSPPMNFLEGEISDGQSSRRWLRICLARVGGKPVAGCVRDRGPAAGGHLPPERVPSGCGDHFVWWSRWDRRQSCTRDSARTWSRSKQPRTRASTSARL